MRRETASHSDTASPTLVVQPILTQRVTQILITQILSHLRPGHLGDTLDIGGALAIYCPAALRVQLNELQLLQFQS